MPRIDSLILLGAFVMFVSGCGSSEQSREDIPPAFPPDSSVGESQPPVIQLEAKTDTLLSMGVTGHRTTDSSVADSSVRFAVQVGAFKEPKNAATMQAMIRAQYREPVMNEFNSKTGLYQIRVGQFASQQAAAAFLRRLLSEHPSSYKGSWVVQLGK